MQQSNLKNRSEVNIEETWNLENIFSTPNDWENAIKVVEETIPVLKKYENTVEQSAENLASFFELWQKTQRLADRILMYGMLPSSVDTSDQEALAKAGQARGLYAKLQAATAFLEPKLLDIGETQLMDWCETNPELAIYKQYFQQLLETRIHIRSAEVEEVLALVGEPIGASSLIYNALTNADLKFKAAKNAQNESIEVGQSNIGALLTNQDRTIRQSAWENYADGYLGMKNTLAATQTGGIQKDVFRMRVRGYESSLQASLEPNKVPEEVFHNLVKVFRKNLPTWHKYWRLRREYLGYEKLQVYDIKAPLSQNSPHIPYEQAIDWICGGMAPLGEEYVSILRNGATKDRWIDRAVNKGKRQGAFSAGVYDSNPFIMMSYTEDVFSLSTLAHELGHSMHSYYTKVNQPYIYSNYSLFVAEVASNFNQAMVRKHLFDSQKDPAFQLALIEETMSNFHRYFFIMPTLARWELAVHERVEKGQPLNADIMTKICADFFREGYGDEVEFDQDRIGITWAQFGHMYMNFYVYQYATGISGAHALVDRVLSGGADAVSDYLGFLSAGSFKYPLDALRDAGVDLLHPEPVQKAFDFMADVVDRFEGEVKKKKTTN
ncbi:MAG: oligoendopeptidase F [Anaerolineaceae bacterium]|nr:oligoendopeptidase F [Anaerolineaceae bacterium]